MSQIEYRSLGEIVLEVGSNLQVTNNVTINDKIRREVNNALYAAAALYSWKELFVLDTFGIRDDEDQTIKTVEADEALVPLPWDCAKLLALTLNDGLSGPVKILAADQLAQIGTTYTGTGRPCYAAYADTTAQFRSLPEADTLLMKCDTDANDESVTSDRPVIAWFRVSSDPSTYKKRTFQGEFSTTGVSFSVASPAGFPVQKIVLPQTWKGELTVEDGDGLVICRLQGPEVPLSENNDPNSRTFARRLLRLFPTPDADYEGNWVYQRLPPRLVDGHDTPAIPVAPYLVAAATAAMYASHKRNFLAANSMKAEAKEILGQCWAGQSPPVEHVQPVYGNILDAMGLC